MVVKSSVTTIMSYIGSPSLNPNLSPSPIDDHKDDEISRSILASFKAKEEEMEKMKLSIKDCVLAQLSRLNDETNRLAHIRQELEVLQDPMRKEVESVRRRIDTVKRELRLLALTCQKKEKEYNEALETFDEKNKEKVQLVAKLMELGTESEALRLKKLEDLTKHIESLH